MSRSDELGGPDLGRAARDGTQRQGGDLRDLPGQDDYLDLSTCANRYGPPETVRTVLRGIDPVELRAHPYDAEALFLSAYAEFLGTQERLLVVGRGITEFIGILRRILPAERVAVITPDYTDTVAAFPCHLGSENGELDTAASRLGRIESAMRQFGYVIASNPNNPLGVYVPRDDLARLCAAYPRSTLIIDEAYIDFVGEGRDLSLLHSDLDNLVVLRSPNKLFGIAGVRVGALWTRHQAIMGAVRAAVPYWPISYTDARVAVSALSAGTWAARTRERLRATAVEMEAMLASVFGAAVSGVPVHYRFVPTAEPRRIWRELLRSGVAVRAFRAGDPGRVPGIRVAAPTAAELPILRSALLTVRS
jgi:histidinol-phosphate aminotransferase